MPLSDFECRICAARDLEEISGYAALPRVTSDCKPFAPGGRLAVCAACGAVQKPTDAKWEKEAATIYERYEPYYQSGGVEQAVFDPAKGEPRRRSHVILDRLIAARGLGKSGKLIDVGCGNGVLLTAFAEIRPGWRLFGHELSDLHVETLSNIPGFERLYTGALSELPEGFDVITMMHALEHFPDPLAGLKELRTKLREGGALFVEVPNGEATPFDLLSADHVSHFTRHDLARLVERAGLGAAVIAEDWVTKELSVVAVPEKAAVTLPPPPSLAQVMSRVAGQIAWLQNVIDGAHEAARRGKTFGIFGSSVAAMWLFGQLSERVAFFVDEDPSREGATLLDRPILTPDNIPEGSVVFFTLIPQVARAVATRLRRPGVEFSLPPEIVRAAA
jgi:SAM-dependent methyltransferase